MWSTFLFIFKHPRIPYVDVRQNKCPLFPLFTSVTAISSHSGSDTVFVLYYHHHQIYITVVCNCRIFSAREPLASHLELSITGMTQGYSNTKIWPSSTKQNKTSLGKAMNCSATPVFLLEKKRHMTITGQFPASYWHNNVGWYHSRWWCW